MGKFISREMYNRNLELLNRIVELQKEKLSIISLFTKENQDDDAAKQKVIDLNNELVELQEELSIIEKEILS